MKAGWGTASRGDQRHPPVEMRFIDMFMTALGSLVFIALLLVFLLPITAEVFMSGTVTSRSGQHMTIATPSGDRKIALDAGTLFRRHIPMPVVDVKIGEHLIAAGTKLPDGSLRPSMVEALLDTPLAEKIRFVFLSGRIMERAGDGLMLMTAEDGRKRIAVTPQTRMIRSLTSENIKFDVGNDIELAGRLNADGSIQALMIQSPPIRDPIPGLEAAVKELQDQKRELEVRNLEQAARIEQLERTVLRVPELEKTIRDLTAKMHELEKRISQQEAKLSELELALRRMPELEARVRTLSDENRRLQADNERLVRDNNLLKEEIARLRTALQQAKTEDRDIQKRWLSVQAIIRGCNSDDVFFYVRNEGKLIDPSDGSARPDAVEFDASRIVKVAQLGDRRSLVTGDTYGGLRWGETGNAIAAFNTVARGQLGYSVYIALKDPTALGTRECSVTPVFSFWRNATVIAERLVLTKDRPFAWARRFQINLDGSTTIDRVPKADVDFKRDLEQFSNEQSRRLCTSTHQLCNSVDAHWYSLRPLAAFDRYSNKAFKWSGQSASTADDVEACQQRCLEAETCVGYTYFRKSSDGRLSQQCRLVEGVGPELIDDSRAMSASKHYRGQP